MRFQAEATQDASELEINITPLVDIVFLLLIFFMVSTTFVESREINVNLPKSATKGTTQIPSFLSVSVKKNGTIFIDGKELTMEQLATRLSETAASSEKQKLVLRADESSTHGRVVEIMDLAYTKGLTDISIATSPK